MTKVCIDVYNWQVREEQGENCAYLALAGEEEDDRGRNKSG